MSEALCSVGLDVGTTSTQIVVSDLTVENRASGFMVPELMISDRKIRYESPVYFTPLLDDSHIDGEGIRKIVEAEYEKAGIRPEDVQTGAIIITGETSRKENAQAVLNALSDFAGEFVVATAGPDLESRLAAKGSGAVDYSERTGKTVLHMDIGGGTSNLALIENGEIVDTGCLNVGGRLVKFREDGTVTWVSQALKGIFPVEPGETLSETRAMELGEVLTQVLEMGAGLRPADEKLRSLITREGKLLSPELLKERPVISFSGGVADCIDTVHPWKKFGDLGPLLGQSIRKSRLCEGPYILGKQTIRATVIGAGCHSTQLSGSTVFYQNVEFPLKNVPAMVLKEGENLTENIRRGLSSREGTAVLALKGMHSPGYQEISDLAGKIAAGAEGKQVLVCLRQDMAKALGQALALRMGREAKILCIDRIDLGEECYLDVGAPVGPAIPVVVKTLILGKGQEKK